LLLFVVPADSDDIRKEYEILLRELKQYNPELLDKKHVLAISKSDMLDRELMDEIKQDLPAIPYLFISSITGYGIPMLKDMLWRELNSDDSIPVAASSHALIHRNLDVFSLDFEPEELFPGDDDFDEEPDEENYFEEDL
jgi:GTP-binding protein